MQRKDKTTKSKKRVGWKVADPRLPIRKLLLQLPESFPPYPKDAEPTYSPFYAPLWNYL